MIDINTFYSRFDARHSGDRGSLFHIHQGKRARSSAEGESEKPPGANQPALTELHEAAAARRREVPRRLGPH